MYARLFKGTGKITKLILRQERVKILVWLLGLIGVTLAAAAAYPGVYPDEQSRQAFALTMENPAMIAMVGPGYALEDYSLGAIFAHEMLLFTVIAVAIMNILLVGRSTRAAEEDGRVEMLRALPNGPLSNLGGSMIVVFLTNVVLALVTGVGLALLDIDGVNWSSSLLYGSILGASGIIFGAISAMFAQLAETSRGTIMLSFTTMILAYLVRAIGDVSNETLSLFSPLGWTGRTGVFAEDVWWPVLLTLAVAILIAIVALYLSAIRDLGSGFIPVRKGKSHASALLRTPFGLILRLQRTNMIAWAIGIFLLSASFGSILGDLETYYADNEFIQAFLSEDPDFSMTEQFITLLIAIMSLISAIPAVMIVLKLKGEETKNRTEHFFSRAVSRTQVLGNYFVLAIVLSIFMQLLVAIGLWSAGVSVMDDPVSFGTTIKSALAYLPAMWLMIGLAVLLIGAIPKASGLAWLYVVYCFIIVYLSELLDFPDWINNLSSFRHVPQIPIEDLNMVTLLTLTLISGVLTFIGFICYNKRDITG